MSQKGKNDGEGLLALPIKFYMPTISHHLTTAERQLASSATDTPRLDAQLLLATVLKKEKVFLLAHPEYELTPGEEAQFENFLMRRLSNEPIAYITGIREFWGLEFNVSPAVLIPRPETELLVEKGIEIVKRRLAENGTVEKNETIEILDLGTGSGCIPLSLSYELQKTHSTSDFKINITAIDRSAASLSVAEQNARKLGLEDKVRFLESDWFSVLPEEKKYDLILSNPPYVEENSPDTSLSTKFEPPSALFSGSDGLDDIRFLVQTAPHYLKSGGSFLFEFGFGQEEGIREITKKEVPHFSVQFYEDLSSIPRVCSLQKMN